MKIMTPCKGKLQERLTKYAATAVHFTEMKRQMSRMLSVKTSPLTPFGRYNYTGGELLRPLVCNCADLHAVKIDITFSFV